MQKEKSRIIVLLIITSFLLILTGCTDKKTDAYKFKEEYESLNGQKSSSGKEYRKLSIDKENPIVYKTDDEIVKLIQDKDTFIVYFGFAKCPWCRSVISVMFDVAKENGINKIYYVDISDIRDKYEFVNGKITKTKEGSDGYNKLLSLLGDKLSNYQITDESGKTTDTGEKRIYAPNIVGVIKGEVIDIQTGISSLQTDEDMQLSDAIKEDSKKLLNNIFKSVSESLNSCDLSGC